MQELLEFFEQFKAYVQRLFLFVDFKYNSQDIDDNIYREYDGKRREKTARCNVKNKCAQDKQVLNNSAYYR